MVNVSFGVKNQIQRNLHNSNKNCEAKNETNLRKKLLSLCVVKPQSFVEQH